ncbi:MAG: hypothetical protein V4604_02105 [Bacteroidota bacterium]
MRFISFIIFSFIFSFGLRGQFELSPVQEIDHVKDIIPVGELNDELYTIIKHKKQVKLQVHSTDQLILKRELELDLRKGGHFRDLETAFIFDSNFVYVTSYANLTTEKRIVELFQVVGDSVLPAVEIAELSMKNLPVGPWREYALMIDCLVSPDGKSLALMYQNQNDMSSVNNRMLVVLNAEIKPVYAIATTVNFPANQSKIRFNVKDQLNLLDGGILVQKTLLGVVVYTAEDQYEILLPQMSANYCVRSLGPGRLVLCGLYNYSSKGFMVVAYGEKYSRVIRQEFELTDASGFQVMDLLVKENREVTLVMEEVVRKQAGRTGVRLNSSQPGSHSPPVSKSTGVEFGDIRLINFSPNGNKTWEYTILKEEIVSEFSEFSSTVFSEGKLIYVLYNGTARLSDDEKSKKQQHQPMVCVVQEDGSAVSTPIFSSEHPALLVPAKCNHLKNGCFLLTTDFFCYFGK